MEDEKPARPIPFRWMDEEFWKDVYKSVVSASIFSILALIVAVVLGYISRPDTRGTAVVVIALGLYIILSTAQNLLDYRRNRQIESKRKRQILTVLLVMQIVLPVVILAYAFATS